MKEFVFGLSVWFWGNEYPPGATCPVPVRHQTHCHWYAEDKKLLTLPVYGDGAPRLIERSYVPTQDELRRP